MSPKNFFGCVIKATNTFAISSFPFLGALGMSSQDARADEPHYDVELSVATSLPECDRKAEFMALLAPLAPGSTLEPPFNRRFLIKISKAPSGIYNVDHIVTEVQGREITSSHAEFPGNMACFEVLYRAAVRTASEIQRDLPLPTPTVPTEPPPLPQCPPTDRPNAQSLKKAKVNRKLFLGAGGVVAFGVAPEIVAGMQLHLGGKLSAKWSIESDIRSTFPEDSRLFVGPTILRVYTVASLTIAPCYRIGSFGGCGLVAANGVVFESLDRATSRTESAWSLGLGIRGFLEHKITDRFSVRADLDLVGLILRTQIEDFSQARWTPALINGSAGLSMNVWF